MQMIEILDVKMIPPPFPEGSALVNLYFRNMGGGDFAAATE
jgi:hypothetical protein